MLITCKGIPLEGEGSGSGEGETLKQLEEKWGRWYAAHITGNEPEARDAPGSSRHCCQHCCIHLGDGAPGC